ncbi:DNA topoisomerase IB [Chitinolyticbacter albus]|uniref:DNA topoisomerase IB n=1 Tax=Chitinolyticbacter albus TaxID=2961951 RepID=UPI002109E247
MRAGASSIATTRIGSPRAASTSTRRRQVDADLAQPGLGADKVLATMIALLDTTLIRVGNARYTRENHSYGLTTLRNRNVDISHGELYFDFVGKSGVHRKVRLKHPQLARIVRRCQALPGQALFQYLDEAGEPRAVNSQDVNDYLRRHAGDFTAKDCRTWAGSVLALALCHQARGLPEGISARKRAYTGVVRAVAQQLGNTPAVCRKSYIHPPIEDAFLAGELDALPHQRARRWLSADEMQLLHLLSTP